MSIVLPNPPDQPGSGTPSGSAELDAQRRITSYFVRTQPVVVTLIPRERVRQPSGGYVWVSLDPRDPQTLRLVEPPDPGLQVQGSDGKLRDVQFILLGEWTATIGRYDVFTLNDRDWEVADLMHYNGWERRAQVIARG